MVTGKFSDYNWEIFLLFLEACDITHEELVRLFQESEEPTESNMKRKILLKMNSQKLKLTGWNNNFTRQLHTSP
jgi:hypothetical protein